MALRLHTRTSRRPRRTRITGVERRGHVIAPRMGEVDRHRRAGGPDDTTLYACGCGLSFRAPVTASVTCPRCGGGLAW